MATAEVLRFSPFGPGSSLRSYSANRATSPLRAIEREMLRSTLNSQFIRRMQKLELLLEETKELSRFAQNWDSYGAASPSCESIGAAIEFLISGSNVDFLPVRALPSAEGGVALRYVAGDKRALVEFLNAGTVEVMLYDEAGRLSPDTEGLGDAVEVMNAVYEHLTR